jgi:hypothetical protein
VPDIILFIFAQDLSVALFNNLSVASDVRDNIELSCAAASTQARMDFITACTDQDGLQGVNCSDLLDVNIVLTMTLAKPSIVK